MNELVFSALADGNRRAMFETLSRDGTGTATALAAECSISRQAAAKHLRLLTDAGLLTAVRAGRETRYRPEPAALRELAGWIEQVEGEWQRRLTALTTSLDVDAQTSKGR